MRRTLLGWRTWATLIALMMVAPINVAQAGEDPTDVITELQPTVSANRYIVGFYKDVSLKPGESYMGERIVAVDHELLYIVVETNSSALFEARVQLDENSRYIQWDNPNYGQLSFVPNDARYNDAGHWGSKKIGAETAWDRTLGTTAVKVATIDSGLNKAHEEFAGQARVLQGWDFFQGDNNPSDEGGACGYHGTHTTGTAGATISNAKGIAGMSQHTILPIKGLGSNGFSCTASDTALANSLKYAADQGAHVSSNSWGGGPVSTVINDAIQYAHDRGVVHVAAAGNSGPCTNCVGEPWKSKASIVTIVASTTSSDAQSSFSSEGSEIDVSAPGSGIISSTSGTTGYSTYDGTSMATPHVSGTAALLKALNPTWGFTEIDGRLKSTAVDLGPAGWDADFGYGRINAAAATASGGVAACGDGIDNDSDGLTDYPADPGCTSTSDTDEFNAATGCSGPANNCFSTPTTVAAGGQTVSQSTSGATTETGEPAPCGSIRATVWFTWTPTTSGTTTVETVGSNYDTVVAAYTGSSLTGLTNRACNDDIGSGNLQSRITFSATAGTTYRIQAGGYNGATGSLTLKVTAPAACPGPANNCFSSPTAFTAKPQTFTLSTSGATLETGEPRPCGSIGATVWYTYTQSTTGTVTFDTFTSGYDTVLAAYTGSSLGSLSNVACNDDTSGSGNGLQSRISFTAQAGVTYRIQAGGYNGATGSLVLHVA